MLVMRGVVKALIDQGKSGWIGVTPGVSAQAVLALYGAGWVTGQILECDGGLGLHSPIDIFGESQKASGTWGQR